MSSWWPLDMAMDRMVPTFAVHPVLGLQPAVGQLQLQRVLGEAGLSSSKTKPGSASET